ncbi:MAG: bifunctional 5,10-methylenetetrahydrofolate dehydrogenase/5,10-methenyltetrahydrofolate cyclohydrolase [Candidatus Parcubacteria bacterium]|nr:bifunctional 5,10-methylenetetrahydrofolate dehydrogenase/5,10-methenyltetrahydrofolate cyclohydrolase [Candidatus Parcubacteria bacterium]
MPAQLLNGKVFAEKILLQVKAKTATMENNPGLAAILVGDNEASKLYLKLKEMACLEAGINFNSYLLDSSSSDDKIIEVINFLNDDPETNGIIVQLPLPEKFNTDKIISVIKPEKDIDGFQPNSPYTAPTALGIIELLKETKVNLKDKNVIILSNSEEFALPLKKLLPDCKVQYINPKSKIQDLKSDILIVAIGNPHFIKPDMIKNGSILIDVGISKVNGKTVGDIDPSCDQVASWRSPVPSGVGPMTVAMLLNNLLSSKI